MRDNVEIFVITNGRETFPYVIKSIENQSVSRKTTVISDMIWVDALNKCANLSKSNYYIRVDDDMFLHPFAISYYEHCLRDIRDVGVFECKLWEDWSNKPAGSLKAYCTDIVHQIGGFKANKLGKVDKLFPKQLKKFKYRRVRESSMVGIHALASVEDQKKYRSLWRDRNATISSNEFKNTFDNIIHKQTRSVDQQYNDLLKLDLINKKYKTRFSKFIKINAVVEL